ncbi:hypothetical protein GGX14DRAFT_645701 [Mycena pura]|uniref:Uncharacterized protein n=1 Tax=Mycena pura TaxID=153505 RepID=A0AAD6V7S2_9AGAR|nr:hypothetical protein GGX14DRAFT_645701 [Mycena pura]
MTGRRLGHGRPWDGPMQARDPSSSTMNRRSIVSTNGSAEAQFSRWWTKRNLEASTVRTIVEENRAAAKNKRNNLKEGAGHGRYCPARDEVLDVLRLWERGVELRVCENQEAETRRRYRFVTLLIDRSSRVFGRTRYNETTGIVIAAMNTAEGTRKMFMGTVMGESDARAAQRPCHARAQSIPGARGLGRQSTERDFQSGGLWRGVREFDGQVADRRGEVRGRIEEGRGFFRARETPGALAIKSHWQRPEENALTGSAKQCRNEGTRPERRGVVDIVAPRLGGRLYLSFSLRWKVTRDILRRDLQSLECVPDHYWIVADIFYMLLLVLLDAESEHAGSLVPQVLPVVMSGLFRRRRSVGVDILGFGLAALDNRCVLAAASTLSFHE